MTSAKSSLQGKLSPFEIDQRISTISLWQVDYSGEPLKLECNLSFPDFMEALAFTNQVAEIAGEINHHPEISLSWGKVSISIYTHSEGGLTDLDFTFAERVEKLVH